MNKKELRIKYKALRQQFSENELEENEQLLRSLFDRVNELQAQNRISEDTANAMRSIFNEEIYLEIH